MKGRMYIAFAILAVISFFIYKPFRPAPAEGNPIAVSGVVINEDNQPIPRAKIQLQGSTVKTYTDRDGKYDIEGTEYGRLAISHSKYRTQDLPIEARHEINVTLLRSDSIFESKIKETHEKLKSE